MRLYPNGRSAIALMLALVAVGALGYTGWRYVRSRDRATCPACARDIHLHSRTLAMSEGKTVVYCCPSCALWDRRQSRRLLEIVELTDQLTGGSLNPRDAFVVVASDVNPCLSHRPTVNEDSQPMHASFDRCEPSVLAFATKEKAADFARTHGGRLLPFATLSVEFR